MVFFHHFHENWRKIATQQNAIRNCFRNIYTSNYLSISLCSLHVSCCCCHRSILWRFHISVDAEKIHITAHFSSLKWNDFRYKGNINRRRRATKKENVLGNRNRRLSHNRKPSNLLKRTNNRSIFPLSTRFRIKFTTHTRSGRKREWERQWKWAATNPLRQFYLYSSMLCSTFYTSFSSFLLRSRFFLFRQLSHLDFR